MFHSTRSSHGGLPCRHRLRLHLRAGRALVQRLESIVGAEVRANRSVVIVAAAFKGKDKLLLEAYAQGRMLVEVR